MGSRHQGVCSRWWQDRQGTGFPEEGQVLLQEVIAHRVTRALFCCSDRVGGVYSIARDAMRHMLETETGSCGVRGRVRLSIDTWPCSKRHVRTDIGSVNH